MNFVLNDQIYGVLGTSTLGPDGITEDGSTPAVAATAGGSSATSLQSASFSPPAATLLVVTCLVNYSEVPGGFPTLGITDSIGGTGWSQTTQLNSAAAYAAARICTKWIGSAPGPMTVTFNRGADSSAAMLRMAVRVVTGTAASQVGAAQNNATGSVSPAQVTVTTTVTGSRVYACGIAAGYGQALTEQSGTTEFDYAYDTIDYGCLAAGRAANLTGTPGSGSPGPLGWTEGIAYAWAVTGLEVLPAGSIASVAPTAGRAAATGIVYQPSVAAASSATASAGLAAAAGAAYQPSAAYAPGTSAYPGVAPVSAAAPYVAGVDISLTATADNPVTVAAAALNATTTTAHIAGLAAATGTAYQPSAGVTPANPVAGVAAASGAARQPSVAAGGNASVSAGLAAAAGAAFQPSVTAGAGASASAGLAAASGAAWPPAFTVSAGLAAATGTGYQPGVLASVAAGAAAASGTAWPPVFTVSAPGLETYGFGAFPQVSPGATIRYVVADIVQYGSDTGIKPPVYQLWDGTTAQIGGPVTGSASTDPANRDYVIFTGITYDQLATLRLRIYASSGGGNEGATVNVDAVSLSVNWVPNVTAAPAVLAAPSAVRAVTVAAGSLVVPAVAAAAGEALMPGNLVVYPARLAAPSAVWAPVAAAGSTVVPAVAAAAGMALMPDNITPPSWATADHVLPGGSGNWADRDNVIGPPDDSDTTWTVPY